MKISEQVSNILKVSSKARNDDRELLILYMAKFGMNLSEEQIATFRKMPSVETIRRTRQQLQERGMYPASPEVDKARFEKHMAMKNMVNAESPENILEQQGYRVLPWGSK